MKRHALALALLLAVNAVAGQRVEVPPEAGPPYDPWVPPEIVFMRVTPLYPTPSDEIIVTVTCRNGSFYTIDRDYYDAVRIEVDGYQIRMSIRWGYNHTMHVAGAPSAGAPQGVVSLKTFTCERSLGRLDPGVYTLELTNYDWGRERVLSRGEMSFEVSDAYGDADGETPRNPDPDPPAIIHPPAEPKSGTPQWFERWRQEHTPVSPPQAAPSLPGIDLGVPPRAKITLTITPNQPSELDEVTLTASCWRDNSLTCYCVDTADLQVGRLFVTLDLHWQATAGLCPASNHSQSLGTLSPGTYFLMVRNYGALGGMALTSFAVHGALIDNDDPVVVVVVPQWHVPVVATRTSIR